jgi:hypothetical protein
MALDTLLDSVVDLSTCHDCAAGTKLVLVGTIQFTSSLQLAAAQLRQHGFSDLTIPQARPLSPV